MADELLNTTGIHSNHSFLKCVHGLSTFNKSHFNSISFEKYLKTDCKTKQDHQLSVKYFSKCCSKSKYLHITIRELTI